MTRPVVSVLSTVLGRVLNPLRRVALGAGLLVLAVGLGCSKGSNNESGCFVVTTAVSPGAATLTTSTSQGFTATVEGAPTLGVVWSVEEGSGGGVVGPDGSYTAPSMPGTYHIVATSAFDASSKATA